VTEDLFLNDGEDRIRVVQNWVFVPDWVWREPSVRGPTVFKVASHLLCPTTENGGTEERPQDGYIKSWPTLAELVAKIGKTERSIKNALRKLEQLGYLTISFYVEGDVLRAEIGLHSAKDEPAAHQLSVKGEGARDAWKSFRGGEPLDG